MRIPHELREEFPEQAPLIKRLTSTNYEFRRRSATTRSIVISIASKSQDEPTTDEVLEKLKKQRLKLKDNIATMLAKPERRM